MKRFARVIIRGCIVAGVAVVAALVLIDMKLQEGDSDGHED